MNRILAALLALACLCSSVVAATLLPPGKQQFLDANGKPLVGGSVAFYLPNTTTAKSTWQDAGQTVLNTNPVVLDSAGRATIYGSGAYRQIVKDQFGNLIFDQVTADTSSSQIAWGGTSGGSANAQTVSATNFTSADGQIVGFIAGFGNTGQLTVNANGSGAIPVLTDSRSGPVNLTGSEIAAGSAVLLVYDAGRGAFHLVGAGLTAPGFGAAQVLTAANVIDLGLAGSHNVAVLGSSASISSFGSSASLASPIYVVTFTGPSLITNGTIATPASADLGVYPGDVLVVAYKGGNAWQVIAYQPQRGATVPSGMVAPFASSACPGGWASANGQAVPRANSALFAAIGTTWGPGDGSTSFNLPDLRGFFLRGVDGGAGRDPGRAFASTQVDQVGAHTHTFNVATATTGGTAAFQYPNATGTAPFATSSQAPATSGETRPINVAVNYCIKL